MAHVKVRYVKVLVLIEIGYHKGDVVSREKNSSSPKSQRRRTGPINIRGARDGRTVGTVEVFGDGARGARSSFPVPVFLSSQEAKQSPGIRLLPSTSKRNHVRATC